MKDEPAGKHSLPETRDQKRRPYRDTSDVTEAVERLIRTVGKRCAMEDPDALMNLVALEGALGEAWEIAIVGIRDSGATDAEIGRELGVTRQAVQQRWPRGVDSPA